MPISRSRFRTPASLRISLDDEPQRLGVDLGLFRLQAVGLELAANQIAPRDLQLLVFGVAGEADDLHPVQQRPRNGVEHIGGGDEHDPGEVERHPEIIVAKGRVLLGIEHFQHRGRRIALNAAPQLVDLVQHHDAIARAGLLDGLDDVARQRADIGAPVAADFRLVVNAAETDPHERPSHRARDRLSQRGLADPGRTDETKDRRLAFRRELANRKIFDDPALDLLQTIMVLVENAPCLGDIDRLFFRQAPGQFGQPVEIAADHAGFGRAFRHPLVAANFPSRLAFRFRRHLGLGDGFVQFRDFLRLAVAFAELALNGRHLLAKDRLALTPVERRLGLLSDLVAEPKHLDALGQMPRDLVHAQRKIDRLEDLLLFLRLDIHVRGREIGQHRRRGGALQHRDQFLRRLRQQFARLRWPAAANSGNGPRSPASSSWAPEY